MDTMRGYFGPLADSGGHDPVDSEDAAPEATPLGIGQDERRMQVRAYNHWASLLYDRKFPAIEDLEPDALPDFGPYSVLLDFGSGVENPGIAYLGDRLAEECDIAGDDLHTLEAVPARSLLTRITDHYMQILANEAPIGFEAEFVNQRGMTIAYRGILLPFSSDDDTIDFIYGVINWKELADVQSGDELLLEIDQALDAPTAHGHDDDAPLTDWADGPGAVAANDLEDEPDYVDEALDPGAFGDVSAPNGTGLPVPTFGLSHFASEDEDEPEDIDDEAFALDLDYEDDGEADGTDDEDSDETAPSAFGSLLKMPVHLTEGATKAPIELGDVADEAFDLDDYTSAVNAALPDLQPEDMDLDDWLAAAREMAAAARGSEDRTRDALYEAVGRAYDFSLAASEAPAQFDGLLADAGLSMQDRAPMTPVVKLVFGADYDKTRLTEYAAALSHAHRLGLPRGSLGEFLREADGGLKGVVKAERRLRKEEAGKDVEPIDAPREALARKLRAMPEQAFDAIAAQGSEFALVMIRRTEQGAVVMLGEVPDDVALVERAARRLIG